MAKLRQQRWVVKRVQNYVRDRAKHDVESALKVTKNFATNGGYIIEASFIVHLMLCRTWPQVLKEILPSIKDKRVIRVERLDKNIALYNECLKNGFLERGYSIPHPSGVNPGNPDGVRVALGKGSDLLTFPGFWKEAWLKHSWTEQVIIAMFGGAGILGGLQFLIPFLQSLVSSFYAPS